MTASSFGRVLPALFLALVSSCGREPTDPARSDLTGSWRSSDQVRFVRNIELEVVQPSPGVVTGKWRAEGRTDNLCPPTGACGDSSIVYGRSEVAQVVLDLLGIGAFVGELVEADRLKGSIRSHGQNFHVVFDR